LLGNPRRGKKIRWLWVGVTFIWHIRGSIKNRFDRKYAKFFPLKLGIKTLFIWPNTFCRRKCLPLPLANADPDMEMDGDFRGLGNGLTTFTFNKDFK